MKIYEVTRNGRKLTMQLSDRDAERLGILAVEVEDKSASKTTQNKARTAKTRADVSADK